MKRPLLLTTLLLTALLAPLALLGATAADGCPKLPAPKTLHRYGVRLTQGKGAIPPERLYVPCRSMKVPAKYDQRTTGCWPKPYDQSQLGSCGPNALAGMAHFRRTLQGLAKLSDDPTAVPSRLFIYRNTRRAQGDIADDTGVDNATMMAATAANGFCFEGPAPSGQPYDISQFAAPPHPAARGVGTHHKLTDYKQVASTDINAIKAAIANNDPVLVGFTVYESFESDVVAQTGVMPMPKPGEQVLGGHDVVAVGYDDTAQVLICRNSWGESWGQDGWFTMPYAFATNTTYASDFYTITVSP